jgi:hypothetical protein
MAPVGKQVTMVDRTYYAAKIEECRRLLESSSDPLYRDVYQAMADEFAEKYAALRHKSYSSAIPAPPPQPFIFQITAEADVPAEKGCPPAGAGARRNKREAALALRAG